MKLSLIILAVLLLAAILFISPVTYGHSIYWLEHMAFRDGESVYIQLNYAGLDEGAEEPRLVIDEKTYAMESGFKNHFQCYTVELSPKDVGIYPIVVKDKGEILFEDEIVVWAPKEKIQEDMIRLDSQGRFVTLEGDLFIIRGLAVNHIFELREDYPEFRDGWFESAWNNAEERKLADWLAYLKTRGVNTTRIGLTVYWDGIPGDLGGMADPQVKEALERYLTIADSMGIKVIPVFYWGHYTTFGFENEVYDAVLGGKHEFEWFYNREAIGLQKQFIADIIIDFHNDSRILAWELMNEIRNIHSQYFMDWNNELTEFIRSLDVDNLITISHLPTSDPQLSMWYANKGQTDFYAYRGYPEFYMFVDLGTYASAYAHYVTIGDKPGILGEFATNNEDYRHIASRDCIWMSLLSGAPGVIGWDHEYTPAGEYVIIDEIMRKINWNQFERATPDLAVAVDGSGEDFLKLAVVDEKTQTYVVPYDVVSEDEHSAFDRYEQVISLTDTSFSIEVDSDFSLSDGYMGKVLRDEKDRWIVLYARNYAGFSNQGFRQRKRAEFELEVVLEGSYQHIFYNLDSRSEMKRDYFTDILKIYIEDTEDYYAVFIWKNEN